jgi:type IV secretory pathway VirB2 component (pilin)
MKKFLFPFLLVLAIASSITGNEAHAQSVSTVTANVDSNSLTQAMCNVMKITTGNAGKAFAAFAIVSVGIGFFTGKVSWGLMVGVAAGIAAMFGAPQIVAAISGSSAVSCI